MATSSSEQSLELKNRAESNNSNSSSNSSSNQSDFRYVSVFLKNGQYNENGWKEFDEITRETFETLILPEAEKNNPHALCDLAFCYWYQAYVKKNTQKSFDLMKQACELNFPLAHFMMAKFYYKDLKRVFLQSKITLEQRMQSKLDYYKKAASANFIEAYFELGQFYSNHLWVGKLPQNARIDENERNNQIFYWYSLAAAKDHAQSQYAVSVCYLNKIGIIEKEMQGSERLACSRMFYEKAIKNGFKPERDTNFVKFLGGVNDQRLINHFGKAEEETRHLRSKHSEKAQEMDAFYDSEDEHSVMELAYGDGGDSILAAWSPGTFTSRKKVEKKAKKKKNKRQTKKNVHSGKVVNNTISQYNYTANLLLKLKNTSDSGTIAKTNAEHSYRSVFLLKDDQLNIKGKAELKKLTEEDLEKKIWPEAKKQNPHALCDLAFCYYYGHLVDKSKDEAFAFMKEAANAFNFPLAQWALAKYLLILSAQKEDISSDKLKDKLESYFKAAKAGFVQAQYDLSLLYLKLWKNVLYKRYVNKLLSEDANKYKKEECYKQIFYWCSLAADAGHPAAQYLLARCYFENFSVPEVEQEKRLVQAKELYEKSLKNGFDPKKELSEEYRIPPHFISDANVTRATRVLAPTDYREYSVKTGKKLGKKRKREDDLGTFDVSDDGNDSEISKNNSNSNNSNSSNNSNYSSNHNALNSISGIKLVFPKSVFQEQVKAMQAQIKAIQERKLLEATQKEMDRLLTPIVIPKSDTEMKQEMDMPGSKKSSQDIQKSPNAEVIEISDDENEIRRHVKKLRKYRNRVIKQDQVLSKQFESNQLDLEKSLQHTESYLKLTDKQKLQFSDLMSSYNRSREQYKTMQQNPGLNSSAQNGHSPALNNSGVELQLGTQHTDTMASNAMDLAADSDIQADDVRIEYLLDLALLSQTDQTLYQQDLKMLLEVKSLSQKQEISTLSKASQALNDLLATSQQQIAAVQQKVDMLKSMKGSKKESSETLAKEQASKQALIFSGMQTSTPKPNEDEGQSQLSGANKRQKLENGTFALGSTLQLTPASLLPTSQTMQTQSTEASQAMQTQSMEDSQAMQVETPTIPRPQPQKP